MADGTLLPDPDKGFIEVDAQPDPSFLIRGMELTAAFPAVIDLRAFEREHLAPGAGDDLLDVGCGIADVSRAMAPGLGRVLGIDASEAMLAVAQERADADGLTNASFRVGDALALGEPDASFDLVRSERMLQWLPEIGPAIDEMVRVLRPGGRLSLIDTDWRTLTVDIPDLEGTTRLSQALFLDKGEPRAAGGRILNLCRDAGLVDLHVHAAAHLWDRWDPDAEPAPAGFFPLDGALGQLAVDGVLDRDVADRLVEQIYAQARADRFFMTLSMVAVVGTKP